MSDSIVPSNSSYCSFVIASQSNKECHFCNWSIHSKRMLTLHPGDATNMLKVVVAVLNVAADWVLVHADDLLVDDGGCDGESDDADEISGVEGWKKHVLGD